MHFQSIQQGFSYPKEPLPPSLKPPPLLVVGPVGRMRRQGHSLTYLGCVLHGGWVLSRPLFSMLHYRDRAFQASAKLSVKMHIVSGRQIAHLEAVSHPRWHPPVWLDFSDELLSRLARHGKIGHINTAAIVVFCLPFPTGCFCDLRDCQRCRQIPLFGGSRLFIINLWTNRLRCIELEVRCILL
ncbi:hypothetical protein BC629DRAFT_340484 [Irpex lacteus]|nr:hypothetical protein BC629DRAFT_340484 [Irpex lacteus]